MAELEAVQQGDVLRLDRPEPAAARGPRAGLAVTEAALRAASQLGCRRRNPAPPPSVGPLSPDAGRAAARE